MRLCYCEEAWAYDHNASRPYTHDGEIIITVDGEYMDVAYFEDLEDILGPDQDQE